MSAKIINCKELADNELNSIKQRSDELDKNDSNSLTIIQVGNNPASNAYVKGKIKDCGLCNIKVNHLKFMEDVNENIIIGNINGCESSAIIVQLPLPDHLNTDRIINSIPAHKDVDGLTDESILLLTKGTPNFIPCTALACIKIIKSCIPDLTGLHAVVIGRSELVGKPTASLLLQENATVTVCHSKTKNLKDICKQADIVISAVGRPNLITGDMIKEGAIVVDVGITRGEDNKLHGDVEFDSVSEVAGYITTVPGGVGLMTRAMLMSNTLKSFNI